MYADDIQVTFEQQQEKNRRAYDDSKHVDECFKCGRGLTASGLANASNIHMLTSGELVGRDAEGDSQGCFPLGSECARQVPAALKFKV